MEKQLPRWDLSLLLDNAQQAISIFKEAKEEARSLAEETQRAISPPINPEQIKDIIVKVERVLHRVGIASAYIYLKYAENTQDPDAQKYMGLMMAESGEIEGYLAKITSTFIGLGVEKLKSLMEHPSL